MLSASASNLSLSNICDSPINGLIELEISTLPDLLRAALHLVDIVQAASESLGLDGARVRDGEIGMEESLEPQSLVLGLGFGAGNRGGQGRSHGIRDGLGGGEERVLGGRVDDVEVGREFMLGQGNDVGQVERVREDADDRRGRVEG